MIDEETKELIEQLKRIADAVERNTSLIGELIVHGGNLDRTIGSSSPSIIEKRSRAGKINARTAKRSKSGKFQRALPKVPANPSHDGLEDTKNPVKALIAAYCEAYKSRYGKNPIIDGRTQGAAKRLAKVLPVDKLHLLLQIYCQMEDKWFVERRHDLSTFEINIGKVDLALHAGHENTNINWNKIFGEGHGQESIPTTNRSNEENLGGTQLPRGAPSTLLAKLPTDPK